jgi:hypothetical protein
MKAPVPFRFRQYGPQNLVDGGPAEVLGVGEQVPVGDPDGLRLRRSAGPYSTVLMRVAGDMAAENRWLIWNQGDRATTLRSLTPGHVVSVLTPASRYMEPFLDHLYAEADPIQELRIVRGRGRFGRQVADGAEDYARQLGFTRTIIGPPDLILADDLPEDWILISAGTFEDDTDTVIRAQRLATPPRVICAVAAGVREFKKPVQCRNGTFGVGQWFSGSDPAAVIGPGESPADAAAREVMEETGS